jgi:hypothetical protein
VHLVAWAVLGLIVVLARPVHFSLQFLVGVGLPLLALGAFGLRRRGPLLMLAVALLFSTSLLAVLRFVTVPRSLWFAPRTTFEVLEALRPSCRPGDVVFAPPDIGLLAYGVTSCRAFISHAVDPDYSRKLALLGTFAALLPTERSSLLDAHRITHLILPGDAGERPRNWLGEDTPFRRVATVGAAPVWSLYRRGPAPLAP